MNQEKKEFWRIIITVAILAAAIVAVAHLCGCQSENTGVSAAVGDITTLPEISDSGDNVSVKVLYMMTGARVWTAKDSNVKVKYRTCHTNDYFGIFNTRGTQDLEVTVEPVESSSETDPEEETEETKQVEPEKK